MIRDASTMVSADLQKMVEIYIKFCPKCVSCELFHLIRPEKSPPSTAHGNRQLTFSRNLVRQLIGTSRLASVQAGREV